MLPQPTHIPHTPGVYIFRKGNTPIYIGKAVDLKKRLISYWRKNAGQKVSQLLAEATRVEWIETKSEIDALLKEAELIKQHIPKYNVVMRDDKNYFYVGIAKEQFPRIFITHQPQLRRSSTSRGSRTSEGAGFLGPFTNGASLKSTLRLLRKIFPFCTCKRTHKRPCLNAEIGRCVGYCCAISEVGLHKKRDEYCKNIKSVTAVLSGKKTKLLTLLRGQMRRAAQNKKFELAAKLRDQIKGIENVFSHRVMLGEAKYPIRWHKIEKNIQQLFQTKKTISRVEGYDISNISGTAATGSLVVFFDGIPVKSEYRKFKIKTVRKTSDVDMLKEVIRRRMRHKEWPLPDLILIDGGKPQLNAARTLLRSLTSRGSRASKHSLITALAKREEELYIPDRIAPIRLDSLPPPVKFFFQRVRDESHRFAKRYHHKLREIKFRSLDANPYE